MCILSSTNVTIYLLTYSFIRGMDNCHVNFGFLALFVLEVMIVT